MKDMTDKKISRRGFLKTAAAIGTALTMEPMLEKVHAANHLVEKDKYRVPTKHEGMQYRTLGSGSASMTVSALGFGCMGMTSAQVALAWLLRMAPFIVPIPGTTKTAHFEENLHTLDFKLGDSEWTELEQQLSDIPVVGDRYGADQQKQVM